VLEQTIKFVQKQLWANHTFSFSNCSH